MHPGKTGISAAAGAAGKKSDHLKNNNKTIWEIGKEKKKGGGGPGFVSVMRAAGTGNIIM